MHIQMWLIFPNIQSGVGCSKNCQGKISAQIRRAWVIDGETKMVSRDGYADNLLMNTIISFFIE